LIFIANLIYDLCRWRRKKNSQIAKIIHSNPNKIIINQEVGGIPRKTPDGGVALGIKV